MAARCCCSLSLRAVSVRCRCTLSLREIAARFCYAKLL
jgi:hypothetical protein